MNSYIQLGLDLKMLEKIDIKIGSLHITGYGIVKNHEEEVKPFKPLEVVDGTWTATDPLPIGVTVERDKTIFQYQGENGTSSERTVMHDSVVTNLPQALPSSFSSSIFPSMSPFPPVASSFPTPEQLELARKKETPREEPTTEQLEAQAALNRLTGQAPAEPKKRGRPKKVKAEDFAGLADPKAETGVPVTSETTAIPAESLSVPSTAGESKTQSSVPVKTSPFLENAASVPSTVPGQSKTLEAWQATPAVETIAEPVKKVIEGLPTPEESLAFRKRMTHYVDDVLSPAGFTSTENIGGPRAKIKLLISKKFGVEAKEMTKWQWQELLDNFENMIQTSGVQSLITHINEQIGAKLGEEQ